MSQCWFIIEYFPLFNLTCFVTCSSCMEWISIDTLTPFLLLLLLFRLFELNTHEFTVLKWKECDSTAVDIPHSTAIEFAVFRPRIPETFTHCATASRQAATSPSASFSPIQIFRIKIQNKIIFKSCNLIL